MSETYYFSHEKIQRAIADLCRANGSPDAEAELVSTRLVKADLTGHPSHGILRIPMYMGMVRYKLLTPGSEPVLSIDNGATAMLDGKRAFGQVAATMAMDVAIERAQKYGVAAIGMKELGHIGRLADYAVTAAEAGCVGLVFTTTGGAAFLVAPFEGSKKRMGTNPIALAVPSDSENPIVLDMATSVWAEGKFRVLRAAGKPAPEKTIIDKDGLPTIDPNEFYDDGAILPLGGKQGYKGYLLNFLVEALGGVLTGGGFVGQEPTPVFSNSTLMVVIDVARFRELPIFKSELAALVKYLKDTPVLEGNEVLYPGEVEARREAELLKTGIPLAVKTVESLQKEMDRYEVGIDLKKLGSSEPLG